MNSRIYLLLDILEDKLTYALQTLQNAEGVILADILEGHPNILVIIEAKNRQKLVELMMPVIRPLENITRDLHLLMTRDNCVLPCFYGIKNMKAFIAQIMN